MTQPNSGPLLTNREGLTMNIYKVQIIDSNSGRVINRNVCSNAEQARASMYAALEFYASAGRAARGQFKRERV